MPATGTPEPGGGHWYPTLALLRELFATKEVIAMDLVELAPLGGLASVVGAYYYLMIVKVMYFDEPARGFEPMPVELKAVLGVTGLFNLLYIFYPVPLLNAASAAAKSLF